MKEYSARNVITGEEDIFFGYDWFDACKRAGVNSQEWLYWRVDFID